MHKIKEKIQEHRAKKAGEQDVPLGATGTFVDNQPLATEERIHHHSQERIEGEVVAEHPVAVGVAEVPVVVTEQERVVGTAHQEHHHAHQEVCGQKTFTEVEDRPVVRERVERIVEHRPVEKQYVVETKFVGEKEMGVAGAEIVDIKDRVVDVAAPGPTCPVNTGAVMNEVISGVQGTGAHHHTGHHTATGTDRI